MRRLRDYVRHEFTHLSDMLDPAFGYAPTLDLPGLNGAQQRLARERYRLLWDITIDGRLTAAGRTPMAAANSTPPPSRAVTLSGPGKAGGHL